MDFIEFASQWSDVAKLILLFFSINKLYYSLFLSVCLCFVFAGVENLKKNYINIILFKAE